MTNKFYKNYKEKNFYIRKKAEYSYSIILIMMGAILLIVLTELFLAEDFINSLIVGSVSLVMFIITLLIIYLGKYELGVDLLIMLGFSRLMMIFNVQTPFQFYSMLAVVMVAVNVIYSKKYQVYVTNIGGLLLLVFQSNHIRILVNEGVLQRRSIYETALSFYLFLAIMLLLRYIRIIIDKEISERELLISIAERDALTSIYNRRKITEQFNDFIAQKRIFKIILFDIDDFKLINDNYGHYVGDQVLIELSKIIMIKYQDIGFARWGGEEFLLIVEEHDDIAEAIRTMVMDYEFHDNLKMTISVGQTTVLEEDTIISAVKRADEAMYLSKKSGKNRVTIL